jgi:hypothetical protein
MLSCVSVANKKLRKLILFVTNSNKLVLSGTVGTSFERSGLIRMFSQIEGWFCFLLLLLFLLLMMKARANTVFFILGP